MNTSLGSLDVRFRPLAVELLAQCVEAKIPVLITCCRRSAEEQAAALASGHSQVTHSLHEDGLAIDIVPFAQFILGGVNKLQWDTADPVWRRMGDIGLRLGLRWGGAFQPLNAQGIGWDPSHFEFVDRTPSAMSS